MPDTEEQIRDQLQELVDKPLEDVTEENREYIEEHQDHLTDEGKEHFDLDAGGEKDEELDEILEKDPDDLTEEEKETLEENKGKLSDEDAEKFGVEKEKEPPVEPPKVGVREDETEDEKKERLAEEKKKEAKKVVEGEELVGEDEELISKQVRKELAPVTKKLQKQADEAEVRDFIANNPEYKKYEKALLVYRKHSAYKKVLIEDIAAIVSSKDQQRIGAAKAKVAKKKSIQSKSGGHTVRTTEKVSRIPKRGTKEFGEYIERVKRGETVPK